MPYANTMLRSRYFHKVLFIFSIFLWVSCNNQEKNAQELAQLGLTRQSIGFLKKEIVLPDEFKKVHLKEIGEMLRQNPDLNAVDKLNYQLATQYQNQGVAPVLFTDGLESPTSIWFIPASYMKLSKEMVSMYTDMLQSSYVIPLKSQGIDIEILKSSFVRINGIEAIKVACKFETSEKTAYQTQYIATRGLDTFSVVVISEFETATDFILKAIQH